MTARTTIGDVGYAVFDKQISDVHYLETRKDCRRLGVASRLWARVREEAVHPEITTSVDTEDAKRRLAAWGFREDDGMWIWRRSR